MTSFFNQYKGLFMENSQLQVPSLTYPPRNRDHMFQYKMNQIEERFKNNRRFRTPKYSMFLNPEDTMDMFQEKVPVQRRAKNRRDMSLANIEYREPVGEIKQSYVRPRVKSFHPAGKSSHDIGQDVSVRLPTIAPPNGYASVKRHETQSSKYGNYAVNNPKHGPQVEASGKPSNYRSRKQLSFDAGRRHFQLSSPRNNTIVESKETKLNIQPISRPNPSPTQSYSPHPHTQSSLNPSPQLHRKHQRRHITQQQPQPSIFLQFQDSTKEVNNYQFLNKRMHDLKKIDNYHDSQKLNGYTNVLIRRRDVKRDLGRKEKLREMLESEKKMAPPSAKL